MAIVNVSVGWCECNDFALNENRYTIESYQSLFFSQSFSIKILFLEA